MIKIFAGKGDKTKPPTVDSSKLEKKDGDKNTKDKNGNSKNALDENKNANEQKVKKELKPKEKKKELTIKKVDKKDKKDKDNKQSAQDKPKEDPNIAVEKVAPSHADGNIEKKEKQKVEKTGKDFENSEMKRRSTSPPSLSSSYRLLPPIKKENEVFNQKQCFT